MQCGNLFIEEITPLVESSQALLGNIRHFMEETMEMTPDQYRLTGMYVLYNNMLQSLFASQIKTIGVVMLGIAIMFLVLFRSITLSIIGILPNLLGAGVVLGVMGWAKIPMDMMTITIAAISVGMVDGAAVLDLDYNEDSSADVDMNVVMTAGGSFVEVQGTAEGDPFDRGQLDQLLAIAEKGIGEILEMQAAAVAQPRSA